ncbi:unnamed protein product [Lactuca saligna]|uniref:Uncharacterized protein n=1 Tax=Lactuca saligna TaxID=75948 RepID=A0AA35V761_LACSI|nr:unnamed protein product [Lactuca saligna]
MASSSSIGSSQGSRSMRKGLRSKCFCGDPVGKWTSWSDKNLERRPSITKPVVQRHVVRFLPHGNGFNHDGFEDFVEEYVEEHVAEVAAEPVAQGFHMAHQDGLAGVNFMIVFWVSLFAVVWYMMM